MERKSGVRASVDHLLEHSMLREIREQPKAIADTLAESFRTAERIAHELHPQKTGMIYFTGSGTSYHACLAANYALSTLTGISATSLPASEFPSWVSRTTRAENVLIAISQSGESADVMAAVNSATASGMQVVAVTNSPGSTLIRATNLSMVAKAGEEEAVTATKSFTATLAATYALVIELARDAGAMPQDPETLTTALRNTSSQVKETLALCSDTSRALALKFKDKEFFFMLGSGPNYSTALEGALKLKESCNLYSEGFATREFLHGPMQLADSGTPVFILQGQGETEQVHDLGGSFLRFGAPTTVIRRKGEGALEDNLPAIEVASDVAEVFSPLIYVVPLQLCAYYSSVIRGLNPDRPEKLTKVVK